MNFFPFRLLFTFCFALIIQFNVSAQPLRVAVAANAQDVIKKLQVDFKKKTGITIEVIIGSSGKLTAQIMNGAPYDVFLSADTEFPEKLYAEGFGSVKPKTYALGSLIICGNTNGDIKNWQKLITSPQTTKLAIANPKTAPYGKAAKESLEFYNLKDRVEKKLVYGESISQVNTYIQTGVVSIGFTTEAFLYENSDKSKLKWTRVDERSYAPIVQSVILLKHAKGKQLAEATKFYDYLSSASARKIITGNGYHLPK